MPPSALYLECPPPGKQIQTERDALECIGQAIHQGLECVVIPAERLHPDFFNLRTRIAGEMIQKFVTYRVRLVVLGDISRHLAESSALRDFVSETNRGNQVWFLADRVQLHQLLQAALSSSAHPPA